MTQTTDSATAAGAAPLAAALTALCVALLTATTLGAVAAMTAGAIVHLIGLPESWGFGTAVAISMAALPAAAMLARRVWRIERRLDDPD
jgi:hypothetical protein